ncbi:MAG TPA: hypothetical protein VMI35_15405 [Puia sp.]|nr:hypothetical protein [Puia sp.]
MKYANYFGIAAALLLIAACFLPWAYYPDLDKTFSGFYSQDNMYGRPGKFFVALAFICVLLFIVPRIWAKRFNLLATVVVIAYAVKTFVLFSSCYRGICPEKKTGLFLMMAASVIMLICALLPDLRVDRRDAG